MKTVVVTFSNPVRLRMASVKDSSPSNTLSSVIIIIAVYTEGSIIQKKNTYYNAYYSCSLGYNYYLLLEMLLALERSNQLYYEWSWYINSIEQWCTDSMGLPLSVAVPSTALRSIESTRIFVLMLIIIISSSVAITVASSNITTRSNNWLG